jgi:uncharacterized protein
MMNRHAVNIVLLITILCLFPLRHLKFDFSPGKFFPSGDTELKFYHEFQNQFQTQIDDEFIFISLENKTGIFQQDFLKKTEGLTKYISGLEHILKVYSITNANVIFFKDSQVNARPLIHVQNPALYHDDSIYLFHSIEYRDLLISKDGKSIVIAAFNEGNLALQDKNFLIGGIGKKINSLGFDEFHFTSKIGVEKEISKEFNKELKIFGFISLLVILLFGFLVFRSFKLGFFILLVVAISTIWTFGIMQLLGFNADMFSIFIPLVLLVATVPGFVQSFTLYNDEVRNDISKLNVLKLAIGKKNLLISVAIAITCFSLVFANISSIKTFGVFSGIGLVFNSMLIAVFLNYYFTNPVQKKEVGSYSKFLVVIFQFALKFKKSIVVFFILLFAASIYFTGKVEVNSKIFNQVPKNSSILKDYQFTENSFSGVAPFEMALTVHTRQYSFFDVGLMKQVEEIESYLRDSCQVGNIISFLSLFKGANKAFNADEISFYKLPEQRNVGRLYEAIMQTQYADEMQHYFSVNGSRIRISGRMHDVSARQLGYVHEKLNRYFNQKGYGKSFSYQITGPVFLVNRSVNYLCKCLLIELLAGFLVLSLVIFYVTRKMSVVSIVLISVGLPLIFIVAVMGALNINVGLESPVLFLIAFGIVANNAMQFFVHQERDAANQSLYNQAVKENYIRSAKMMITSTFILFPPMLILSVSKFEAAFHSGVLLCICLISSLLTSLCLVPFLKKTSLYENEFNQSKK